MARQLNWINPRWVGIAITTGTSFMLVFVAEKTGQESLIGIVAALLMGLHMALSPHIFAVRPARVKDEESRDRFPVVSTTSFLLLGAYLVMEFLVH